MKQQNDLPDEPKTPHEEVMFVVESTNDIVSHINDCMGDLLKIQEYVLKILEKVVITKKAKKE